MNKKIYKGYELIKAIEDEQIEEGTILTFTSTIAKDNKKEVEVIRKPGGLVLFKKDTPEILPTSWLLNAKIEVLEDNTEEIEELPDYNYSIKENRDKINELVKRINYIERKINDN